MTAKNYEGRAQTASIIALVKRGVGVRYRTSDAWYGTYDKGPHIRINGRGNLRAAEIGLDADAPMPRHSVVDISLYNAGDDDGVWAGLLNALGNAGWEFVIRRNPEGRMTGVLVMGPGWREWFATAAVQAIETRDRRRENTRKALDEKRAIEALLAEHGIARYVEAHDTAGTASVTLYLADFEKLLGALA